ncbi:S-protein homolog 1-like [Momordica charantia]|uniref:S-protein homolog n=1 Tax=Momordica charantia TaxID=3673 RepID=A0A6J1DPP7_MOMCH|nr:S-protein homolog 1-like [Momordica charantia]
MDPTGRHMIVLLVWSALVVAAAGQDQLSPVVDVIRKGRQSNVFHLHMVNGLDEIIFVRCKSKDTNIGDHFLDLGAEIVWHFEANIWGTTLYWCYAAKAGAKVSFDVFWSEKTQWLGERCGGRGVLNLIWIAKEDGIYLRNLTKNVDELIHKWNE